MRSKRNPVVIACCGSITRMLGRKLETIVDAGMPEGTHRVNWTNEALPSGLYTVVLRAGGRTAFRVMSVSR